MRRFLIATLLLFSTIINGAYIDSVEVSNFPSSFGATQTGAWNVSILNATLSTTVTSLPPVTGTVTANLGTIAGVATETTLSAINTKTPSLGQALMSASSPVVIASNQSAIPVTGTFFQATQPVSIASTVNVNTGLVQGLTDAQLRATPVPVSTGLTQPLTDAQLRATAVPVSGSVTANIGTTNGLALDSSVNTLLKPASTLSAVTTLGSITNAVTIKADTAVNQVNALKVDGSAVTQPISGSVAVNNFPATQAISASSLPLPTGASTLSEQQLQTTALNKLANPQPTFVALATVVATANNKTMLAVANTGSNKVRVRRVYLVNTQNTAVAGVVASFSFRRVATATGGTAIPIVLNDTTRALASGITASTNSTLAGTVQEFRRTDWSTDEWVAGTLDLEGYDHSNQSFNAVLSAQNDEDDIVVNGGETFAIVCTTNTTTGVFDARIIFTVE